MKELLIATKNVGKAREIGGFFAREGIATKSLLDFPEIKAIEETGKTFEENVILKAKSYFELARIHLKTSLGRVRRDLLDPARRDEEAVAAALQQREATPRGEEIARTLRDTSNSSDSYVAPPRSIAGDTPSSSLRGLAGIGRYRGEKGFEMDSMPCVADDGGLEIDALNGEPGVKSRRWIGREMTDWEMVDYALLRLKGVPAEKRTARLRAVLAFCDDKECFTDSAAIEGVMLDERPKTMDDGFPFRKLLFIPRFGKLYGDLTHEEHEVINHRREMLRRMLPRIKERLW